MFGLGAKLSKGSFGGMYIWSFAPLKSLDIMKLVQFPEQRG
jgi:hypothetical protein